MIQQNLEERQQRLQTSGAVTGTRTDEVLKTSAMEPGECLPEM